MPNGISAAAAARVASSSSLGVRHRICHCGCGCYSGHCCCSLLQDFAGAAVQPGQPGPHSSLLLEWKPKNLNSTSLCLDVGRSHIWQYAICLRHVFLATGYHGGCTAFRFFSGWHGAARRGGVRRGMARRSAAQRTGLLAELPQQFRQVRSTLIAEY